ncbi:histidine kinase [Niastella sp. OAS944]|uniref:histidine kinase n=1 Tax=Niastella sp. OAS944 TaxID=2664089 RepID=UPI00348D47DB|nr:tetratricopeptide (TPR) repeat protein [Chitinophagaceae bacterium OAS944]
MRHFLFLLVVFAACQQTNKIGPASQTNLDTITRRIYKTVEAHWDKDLWDSAGLYLNQVRDSVQKLNYGKLNYMWNLCKSQQATIEGLYDSSTYYFNTALQFGNFKGIRTKDSIHFYLVWQHLLKKQQLYDSAIHPLNQAYNIAILRDSTYLASICYELAHAYISFEDLPNTYKYLTQAWKLKDKEPGQINQIARLFVDYYEAMNDMDSASYFLNAYGNLPGDVSRQPISRAGWYETVGVHLLKKGRFKEGLQSLLMGKKIRDSVGNRSGYTYNNLGEAYRQLGQFDEAYDYIDSAILLGQKIKNYHLLELAWRTKSEVYLKQDHLRNAYTALDSSHTAYMLLMDSSLRNHAREVETKYAVREKDNQIKTLEQSNEANVKIRNQQRLLMAGMIIGGLLLGTIGLLLWNRRKLEMQRAETVLKQQLFRTQMEPHFLYNFMSVIQSFIWHSEPEIAADYLNKFSRLMRLNFANSQNDLVSLHDEVEALENFLSLQQLLHDRKFDYHIETSLPHDAVLVPPMIIQPFVENAIMNGFANTEKGGMINIALKTVDNFVYCLIEDNGQGFANGFRVKPSSTVITQKRLNILSRQTGRKAKLSVIDRSRSKEGHGVRVEIWMPYMQRPSPAYEKFPGGVLERNFTT